MVAKENCITVSSLIYNFYVFYIYILSWHTVFYVLLYRLIDPHLGWFSVAAGVFMAVTVKSIEHRASQIVWNFV